MLQKATQHWYIQVLSSNHHGEGHPKAVAYDLKGNIVHVGFMAGQKDNRLFLLCSLCRNFSKAEHFLAGHMDPYISKLSNSPGK